MIISAEQGSRLEGRTLRVPCLDNLKITLPKGVLKKLVKVNHIEISPTHAYVACEVIEASVRETNKVLGVDLNATTGAFVADPSTGKVRRFATDVNKLKEKYRMLRRKAKNKKRSLARLGRRERNKTLDVLRKSALELVRYAVRTDSSIKFEDLNGLRNAAKKYFHSKRVNASLNSWPRSLFTALVLNKAKELGVKVDFVDPKFTSQSVLDADISRKRTANGRLSPA